MTNTMSLRVLAGAAVLAGAFLIAPFAFAAEAEITSISTGDATPSIEGTAIGTETVDLSITQDDSEVYASADIAVTDGAWSHDVADELANGDYVAVVSASSTELATTSFTVAVEEDPADDDTTVADDGDETVEERLARMQAFIEKLQALITKLTTLRERVGSRAQGPVKNPHLNNGVNPGQMKKMDDDSDDSEDDDDDDNSGKAYGKDKNKDKGNSKKWDDDDDSDDSDDDDDDDDSDDDDDDDDSDDDNDSDDDDDGDDN